MDKLKNTLKGHFSSSPKAMFIVVLVLIGITMGITAAKKTVTVSIDGKETKIVTFRKTFKDALKANNIVLGPKDKTTPSLDSKVNKNDRIDIKKAVNVTVTVDGQELNIQTAEDTVDKMFEVEGIEVGKYDKISPTGEIPIHDGLKLVITRVETKVFKEIYPIEYSTVVKNNDEEEKGNVKVLQEGQQGQKYITTRVVYEDGKEVSRDALGEVVTKEPVSKVVAIGTLGSLNLSRGGKVLYKTSIKVKATAYTSDYASTGKNPGDDDFGRTATGTLARRNVNGFSSIAVDPRVIPYGTKLYVEGYGYAIAEDTGGAIKGNTIDVYFNSAEDCSNWGVRYINVYILK